VWKNPAIVLFGIRSLETIASEKKRLRNAMQKSRDSLSAAFRLSAAEQLAQSGTARLGATTTIAGRIIAGYMPLRSEMDPLPLMAVLEAAGARLALPRMHGDTLVFHACAMTDPLEIGPFGIREPGAATPVVQPDVILTPLLAFDRHGGRLGYGKGFYDRAFAALPEARRIGIGFAMQDVVRVPCEAHDILLDLTLTEA
jgi:5-formyltetrahydrofolate cyclo-ligase